MTDSRPGRLRTFLAQRLARGEYLGLHLTVGFLVSVAGAAAFAALAEDVIEAERITQVDVSVNHWFGAHATPTGLRLAYAITTLGSPVSLTLLALFGAVVLVRVRSWVLFTGWAATFLGGGLLDFMLKLLMHRPRPAGAETWLTGHSWSFPSGHAMNSLVGFGMLAWLLVVFRVHQRAWRSVVVAGCALLAVVIGCTRLYLGVHYLSDVLAGWAAGILWLSACVSGLEVVRRMPRRA